VSLVTAPLAKKITAITYEMLPDDALEQARMLVLDGLAVAVAGASWAEGPRILAEHLKKLGGTPECQTIGFGFKTNPVQAAYLNGTSMHVLDYEPMWSPANHAISTTLPAVLALSESKGIHGREVLAALIKGIEIQGWIRVASGQLAPTDLTYHPPGITGPFSSAVAAAHLLGMDSLKLQHAIGLAASRTGSLLANIGSMTKATHCGLGGSLGLDAALLAAQGFTANPEIFEAPKGFSNTVFDEDFDNDALIKFGAPWRIVDPGPAIKMFPNQFATHYGVTAGLAVHPDIPSADAIQSVTLVTPMMAYIDRPKPETGLAGKFSWQYTLAVALLDGRVGIDSFTDERRFQPDVESLLGKITIDMDDSIPGTLEDMHVELTVTLNNGEALQNRCDGPKGLWGSPSINTEDHLVKVRDCLARSLTPGAIEDIIGFCAEFDHLDSNGIKKLMALTAKK
jgi:2-methylcitrate dehydratase PrpD